MESNTPREHRIAGNGINIDRRKWFGSIGINNHNKSKVDCTNENVEPQNKIIEPERTDEIAPLRMMEKLCGVILESGGIEV